MGARPFRACNREGVCPGRPSLSPDWLSRCDLCLMVTREGARLHSLFPGHVSVKLFNEGAVRGAQSHSGGNGKGKEFT